MYRPVAALAQRDPQEQDQGADADDDPADRQPGALGKPLVEHVPWPQPEPGDQHHGHAHAEQDEPGVQVDQAATEPIGPGRPAARRDPGRPAPVVIGRHLNLIVRLARLPAHAAGPRRRGLTLP
jgi:hypothetical protein